MPVLIANLATKYLKLPIRIEVAPQGTIVKNVTQEMIVLEAKDKMKYLEKIIKENEGSILIFVRTRYGVKNIARKLISNGHKATEIHSDLSQGQRKRALDSFKSGRSRIMVATDVAARGLDVKGIELVINYDLPDSSSDYVHRIGRTARAGKKGKAISLATPGQLKNIKAIEALIKMRFNIVEHAKLEPVYTRKRSFHSKRY
jgi:ATP-dependent RNA helicase RhlE